MGSSMRRSGVYALMAGLLFLSLLAWSHAPASVPAARIGDLGPALAGAGASLEKVGYNAWARLPRADLSDAELQAVAEEAMARLGHKRGEYEVRHGRSERHRLVRAELAGPGLHAVVVAQVLYPAWDRQKAEAYLVVNVETLATDSDIAAGRTRVAAAASAGGGSPLITTCLVGWLDGKLEKDEWSGTLHSIRQTLGAAAIDTLVEANYASMTAFAPGLPDSLVVGDKRVNLNMALRYSPYDNRTYVVIASPVISGEY